MTRSLFLPHLWQGSDAERAAYIRTIRQLGHLAPEPLYDMLWAIRRQEVDRTVPGRRDAVAARVRAGLARFPDFAHREDLEEVVAANTDLLIGRAVDWVYITACQSVEGLGQRLVTVDHADRLVGPEGAGTIIAPFHLGPNELLLGTIARRFAPVTVVSTDRRLAPTTARYVKRLSAGGDIEMLSNADLSVLLRCRHALRRGRIVAMFPEFFLSSDHKATTTVAFGGRTVVVPVGLAHLARIARADVVPCYVRREPGGRYRCVIGPRLAAGADLLDAVFAYYERLISDELTADWECWAYAPHLLTPAG